jgi:hypothetical protein
MQPDGHRWRKPTLLISTMALLIGPAIAQAQEAEPAAMAPYELHYQTTYIWQRHPTFAAAYSGPNSLRAEREPRSFTLTGTAYFGVRAWPGGEIYFNPEVTSSESLSDLHGLGGLTNGEDQKGGGKDPRFYRARLFARQTWNLGGGTDDIESAPNQLAGTVDRNRLVLTVGTLSLIDIFDNNAYSHDPRTQFLNWTMMAAGAFDFAADTRGYTSGFALEYYRDGWALRFGRFMQAKESNGQQMDVHLFRHYGDQIEVEHDHELGGQPGKLRLLAFRNHVRMGGFQDALDAWRANGQVGVPSVADVRKERSKTGWAINLEQAANDAVGLFARLSANDGKSETYAFTEAERSLSAGISLKGNAWRRAEDVVGFGLVRDGLADAHRQYLANGGLGAFIGDGVPPPGMSYRYAAEQACEAYYNLALGRGVALALDVQRIRNPGYNAARGPANFLGLRLHAEI